MKKIIAALFVSLNLFYAQEFNPKIEDEINKILEEQFFQSSVLSINIFDLSSEEYLYSKNNKLLLRPASNMKIITSATALEYLGPDYEFETSVYHTGIIMDSICYGDVIVKGGFDPDFITEDLDTLIFALKDFGIKEIRGNIYGDVSLMDSLFWGAGWMWDDDPYSFAPYMSPLIINDLSIEISYEPGFIGKPAKINLIPKTDFFDITNTSVTTKEDTSNLEITRAWINRGNELIISGDLSYKAELDTVKRNIVNPEYYFLYLMKEKILQQGIEFIGLLDTLTLPEYSKLIYSKKRKFSEVITDLNKESDNLSAEMTLRAIGLKYYGKTASAKKGVHIIDSMITKIGLDPENYSIVDGSGLSTYNLITTELVLEILKYLYYNEPENYEILKKSFPIAGVDGTLKNRMKQTSSYKNVRAKTGTLTGASSLSGYLTSADGHDIAFSMFVQNYVGSAKTARAFQDKICNFLTSLKLED
ncbi:MAG: D-alanyl-D-alanine carboxypeptidase/D-alanyl-D-alanine-endopeptidase [Ignavibacteriae bacterium]|nr:MAG: D-alanyl-D-alanine carboxypeptidase/D-alanyl-D-alanine-endopeptidase [Ignavibacteriota bacterium]